MFVGSMRTALGVHAVRCGKAQDGRDQVTVEIEENESRSGKDVRLGQIQNEKGLAGPGLALNSDMPRPFRRGQVIGMSVTPFSRTL